MNAMQVLIIDDNPALRLSVAECVVSLGHTVSYAQSVEQALVILQQKNIDLVLLDLDLPSVDSIINTEIIQTLNTVEHLSIIVLTNSLNDVILTRAIKAGVDAYLEKPLNPLRLQLQLIAQERIYLLRKKLQAAQRGLGKLSDTLKYLSMYDHLTGLANRRNFDDTLRREFKLAQRDKSALSLLLCDIDFFKRYNEQYGQAAGDACLSAIATTITSISKRPTDLACRYGGEEFTVILPKTQATGAKEIAEKLLHAVQQRNIPHQASPLLPYVSLSIGTATMNQQFFYVTELMKAAEAALYQAKQQGRNCVVSQDELRA